MLITHANIQENISCISFTTANSIVFILQLQMPAKIFVSFLCLKCFILNSRTYINKLFLFQTRNKKRKVLSLSQMIEDYRSLYSTQSEENNLLSIDEYGFISTKDSLMVFSEKSSKMEWYELIDCHEDDMKKFKEIVMKKRLLQKGIPLFLKSRLWVYFLSSSLYKSDGGRKLLGLSKIVRADRNKKVQAKLKYLNLIEQKSKYEYQMHMDTQRTFRNHFIFHDAFSKGQSELFNILIAFSNNFKSIGYCQYISDY